MKSLIIIFAIGFITLVNVYSENNFRSTKWGMSIEEVKKTETSELIEEAGDLLSYKTVLDNRKVQMFYMFINNKLYQSGYITYETYTNEDEYFIIFSGFKKILIDKYGNAKEDKKEIDKKYKNNLGKGLLLGKVFYYTFWEFDDISITIILSGGKNNARISLYYLNKELDNEASKKKKEKTNSQF